MKLKHSKGKLKKIYTHQRNVIGRTFYDEKDASESILQNRFNFLLVIYSLFIGAFMISDNKLFQLMILSIGLIVIIIIGLTLYRIHIRLDILLRILYQLDDNHVFPVIDKELRNIKSGLFKVNRLLAVFIPVLLALSFCVCIILVVINVL